jgi:signal transduction histidine kinase
MPQSLPLDITAAHAIDILGAIVIVVGMLWIAGRLVLRRGSVRVWLSKPYRNLEAVAKEIKALMRQITERGDYSVRVHNPNLIACWKTKKCGQTGCPSYGRLDNLRCWEVSGTCCRGEVQGVFAKKLGDCRKCRVYEAARRDSVFDLAESFNEMILMIGDRHESLDAANRQLAAEVERADSLVRLAQEGTKAKGEFLANVSHELRTPVTAILGYTDILLDEIAGLPAQEYAAVVKRNGERLLELINDVLDLSKAECAELVIEPANCSPTQLAEEVVASMRVRADAKHLSLTTRYVGPLPETVLTDPLRLRQVLANLVGNAIKFTDQGAVQLAVRMDSEDSSASLCFDVADTGIGMNEEQIDRLFQPFTQVDKSAVRKAGGTGLGLCISKRLVEAMGGSIQVSSVPGGGSTFTVKIGLGSLDGVRMTQITEGTVQPSPSPRPETPASGTALSGRVLLVEDGLDNQRLFSLLLCKAGAQVTAVENGQLAVRAALTANGMGEPFDLILMDMQMPVLDGYQATRQLRALGCVTPIIAVTAHAMPDDCQKCLDAGCNGYLTKPIDRQKLLASAAQWITGGSVACQSGDRRDEHFDI